MALCSVLARLYLESDKDLQASKYAKGGPYETYKRKSKESKAKSQYQPRREAVKSSTSISPLCENGAETFERLQSPFRLKMWENISQINFL